MSMSALAGAACKKLQTDHSCLMTVRRHLICSLAELCSCSSLTQVELRQCTSSLASGQGCSRAPPLQAEPPAGLPHVQSSTITLKLTRLSK